MIAREGIPFVLIGLLLTTVAIWGANRLDNKWLFGTALIIGILTLFTLFFFRDPDRTFENGAGVLVSPADGKVIGISTGSGHPYLPGEYTKVSIFLNVFDVHVNRIPATGVIDYVKYNPGKFFAAFEDKASELNEQTEIGMTTETGQKIMFKQIAGLIARRIVYRVQSGDAVEAGSRFGLIRFGSRTELFVPTSTALQVKVGDRVAGGKTIIGRMPVVSAATQSMEQPREQL
ncbi:MAG: phosphatidylserine decarboxylase family protein [bacterium]|nr:phosphatidylserine decarboxylase family protein [bacterium]